MPLSQDLLSRYNNNKIFIETGTFMGEGVITALKCGFKNIYSIEIAPRYYAMAVFNFLTCGNVRVIHGDSAEWILLLLKKINIPVTFWLDAHTPGCPLMKELEAIKKHKIKTHTILIDDRRNFGQVKEMKEIKEDEVIAELKSINHKYKFTYESTKFGKNDIIIACL